MNLKLGKFVTFHCLAYWSQMYACLSWIFKPDADTILNDHVKQNYDCEGNVVRMSPLTDCGSRGYPT